jgi:hypothetical protein
MAIEKQRREQTPQESRANVTRDIANNEASIYRLNQLKLAADKYIQQLETQTVFAARSPEAEKQHDAMLQNAHGILTSIDYQEALHDRAHARLVTQLPRNLSQVQTITASRGIHGTTSLDVHQGTLKQQFNLNSKDNPLAVHSIVVGHGIGSEQVANDEPYPAPRPSGVAEIDRRAHRAEMRRDDERAADVNAQPSSQRGMPNQQLINERRAQIAQGESSNEPTTPSQRIQSEGVSR